MDRTLQVYLIKGCRRFFLINLLWGGLVFISLLAIAGSVFLLVSSMTGSQFSAFWVVVIAAVSGFLLSMIYALVTIPSLYRTAVRIDRLGKTGDLFHTAWEFSEQRRGSAFRRPLLKKASTLSQNLSVGKLIRLPSGTFFFPVTAALIVLFLQLLPFSQQPMYSSNMQTVTEYQEFSSEEIRRFRETSLERLSEKDRKRLMAKGKATVAAVKKSENGKGVEDTHMGYNGESSEHVKTKEPDKSAAERQGGMGDGTGEDGRSEKDSVSSGTSVPDKLTGIEIKAFHPDTADSQGSQDKYSKFIFSSPSQVDIIIKQDRIPGVYHDVLKRYFTGN